MQTTKLAMKVEGVEDLASALKRAPKVTRALLSGVFAESVEVVARVAKTQVPRDRSDLYAAIKFEGRGVSWRAGVEDVTVSSRTTGRGNTAHMNPSVYGRFVEYGTSDTGAHPFMRPAADGERERLPGRLREMATRLPRAVGSSSFGMGASRVV